MTDNPQAIQEKEENKEKLLSTIWQADVLDHCSEESHLSSQDLTQAEINLVTRLRAPINATASQELKPISQE